jgi:hypothetical protein
VTATLLKIAPNDAIAPGNEAIAESLRRLADAIEGDAYDEVATVVCVIEPRTEPLTYQVYGDRIDTARMLGLLTMSAIQRATE